MKLEMGKLTKTKLIQKNNRKYPATFQPGYLILDMQTFLDEQRCLLSVGSDAEDEGRSETIELTHDELNQLIEELETISELMMTAEIRKANAKNG